MQIALPLFDDITALDAVGPYEVLQRLPGAEIVFVGHHLGEVRSGDGFLGLTVDATFDQVDTPDVVVVPGGFGAQRLAGERDAALLDWLRGTYRHTRVTASVCTGALLLGAAGLLDGLHATTHWNALEQLRTYNAEPTAERIVEQRGARIITAAGVSAGIDMALLLVARLADDVTAKAVQLQVEYDPHPPFDAGSVDRAGSDVLARARELYTARA